MTAPTLPRATRLLLVLLLATLVGLGVAPVAAASVARAIVDVEMQDETEALQAKHMHEIGTELRTTYVRLSILWSRAEPQKGVYDEALLASTDRLLDLADAEGVRVVLTVAWTPKWASDQSLWSDPPLNVPAGEYRPYYAPRLGAVDDFSAFAGMLATRYKGLVFAYECWNEPNIWTWLYPQTRGANTQFAAERYTQLLKAFAPAVRAADPDALVIGGVTAPIGDNNQYRTSPQRFARLIKDFGALSEMDAYAHHPYQPGPRLAAPEAPPLSPDSTVTLQNLGDLLAIVPDLPFYLTEYGYNTAPSSMFGVGTGLSQATQADYLRRAYRYATRYPRVKALFWYLRQDTSPSGKASDANGVYTGLRTISNFRKRSWFAFAGGMKLTLVARSPIRKGTYTKLTGALTCSRLANAGVWGKQLEAQRRVNGAWKTMKRVTTRSGGRYATYLRLYGDARLRVVWSGVVVGPARFVDVR